MLRASPRLALPGRLAVVTAVVAGYVVLGFELRLDVYAYLVAGVPIGLVFQRYVARQPIRALWLRDARPLHLGRAGIVLSIALAIVPLTFVAAGLASRNLSLAAYGFVIAAGSRPAAYALRALTRRDVRELARTMATAGVLGTAVFVLSAYSAQGAHLVDDPLGRLRVFGFSLLLYVPAVFVLEEVLFRGAFDSYLHPAGRGRGRVSAVVVSALWGVWHLPVLGPAALAAAPFVIGFHTILGLAYSGAWRRTGKLAVPGLVHAASDAVRDALIAF